MIMNTSNTESNSRGEITQYMIQQKNKYGAHRVALAKHIVKFFDRLGIRWFIDTGTLLGAYRNGRMLPHDDDFDIGVMGSEKLLQVIYQKLKKRSHMFGETIEVICVDSYCKKVEVFDTKFGKYELDCGRYGTNDYHNVTVDIQLYSTPPSIKQEDLKPTTKVTLEYYKDNLMDNVKLKVGQIIPYSTIIYEDIAWSAPHQVTSYLKSHYGYIGPNAIFDPKTMKYKEQCKTISRIICV